jgi:hypothetical protein
MTKITKAEIWQMSGDSFMRDGWYVCVYPHYWVSMTECPARRYDTKEKAIDFARRMGAKLIEEIWTVDNEIQRKEIKDNEE